MEPPDRGDPSREDPRRPLSAGNQRYSGADSQRRSLEPLQESPGGGGCFLPSQRLFTSAAGVSLATGSGSQPCVHLFPGLLVERQTGTAVAAEGPDHRSPQSAASATGHPAGAVAGAWPALQNDGRPSTQGLEGHPEQAGASAAVFSTATLGASGL